MTQSRYILSKRINRGGMAEIFLGKAVGDDGFERIVVMKRILPHYAADQEFIEMFRDEAHICKRLQHANIVQVYSFEEVEGSYAIIMEFVDGADLRTLLAACEKSNERVPLPIAIYITAMAARGLHYAHTRIDEVTGQPLGIVHRDISPQNILLSYQGDVKVTDFGIADAENKLTETKPGIVKGKYAYMSPEQINAKSIDARSDVFALAIVLWETLSMRRLFQGENEVQTIKLVQTAKVRYDIKEFNPEINDDLYQIIDKGLQKDIRKRYPSGAAFEKALLKYLHSYYPEFSSTDLGDFLKTICADKRKIQMEEIRKLLTQTDLKKAGTNSRNSLLAAQQEKVLEIGESSDNGQAARLRQSYQPRGRQSHNQVPSNISHLRQNQAGSPQMPMGGQHRRQSSSSGVSNSLMKLAIALLLITGVGLAVQTQFSAKNSLEVEVATSPENVRISVNDKPLFDNAYVSTPRKLLLNGGNHVIRFSRDGYKSIQIEMSGKAGEKKKARAVNLALNLSKKLKPITIKTLPAKKIKLRISEGYSSQSNLTEREKLKLDRNFHVGTTPYTTVDLEHNKTYILYVYLTESATATGGCEIDAAKTDQVIFDINQKKCILYK